MNILTAIMIIKNQLITWKIDLFSKLKNPYPSDVKVERTKEKVKFFNIKNREEISKFSFKSYIILLTSVFEVFIKVSIGEFESNSLNCVSLPGYTWQCGLKCPGNKLQTLQDKEIIPALENYIRGGISSVMGKRYVKSDETRKFLVLLLIIYMVTQCHNHYHIMTLVLIKLLN